MDMLRWPAIHRMADESNGSARFLIVMESNGADPAQRDSIRRAYWEGRDDPPTRAFEPGTIYRADIEIPAAHRNDPEYIAFRMADAWLGIYKDTQLKRGVPEGAEWGWKRPSTGTWMQNVRSGVRSVLRTLGLMPRAK